LLLLAAVAGALRLFVVVQLKRMVAQAGALV
jgi:hypothetical protein